MNLVLSISYKINDDLAVGTGLLLGYADMKANLSNMNFAQTSGNSKLNRIFGYGIRIGAHWKANEDLQLGASYSSPILFEKLPHYQDIFPHSLNTPMTTTIGFAYYKSIWEEYSKRWFWMEGSRYIYSWS